MLDTFRAAAAARHHEELFFATRLRGQSILNALGSASQLSLHASSDGVDVPVRNV